MKTFSALLAICAGNSPVAGEFPAQRPVTRSFDVFFHLRLNKRLSKQSKGWWFETLSRPLWRHRNGSIRMNFTSVLLSWSHQATGPVRLDTVVHSWFGRIIRRTQRVPVRCPYGHRMGIFNVFHILRDPYGARAGLAIRTHKGIDTTQIGKNPTRASYLVAWGPDGPLQSPHGLFSISEPVRGP